MCPKRRILLMTARSHQWLVPCTGGKIWSQRFCTMSFTQTLIIRHSCLWTFWIALKVLAAFLYARYCLENSFAAVLQQHCRGDCKHSSADGSACEAIFEVSTSTKYIIWEWISRRNQPSPNSETSQSLSISELLHIVCIFRSNLLLWWWVSIYLHGVWIINVTPKYPWWHFFDFFSWKHGQ